VDGNDEPNDPFAGLEDWARDAEKRVRKQVRREPKPPRAPKPPRRPRAGSSPLRSALLVAAVAVGAVVLASVVPGLRSFLPKSSSAAAYPTESVPPGVTVTTSVSAAAADPFAGTPAAHYPKGAAGITLPVATKVTGLTAAEVGADLRRVRAAMIAGRLDPRMLVGHQPDRFLALLAPANSRNIRAWFKDAAADSVATRIDPAVRLDPAQPPRVSGRVTYRSLPVDSRATLRVTTNFVWVYAFDGPRHPLAVEHDEIDWDFPDTHHLRAADQGMSISSAKSYAALIDCAAGRKGLFAPTRLGDQAAPAPSGTENDNDYLRADHSLDINDDCGMASKSPAPVASPS
jgi:hypothetical protein